MPVYTSIIAEPENDKKGEMCRILSRFLYTYNTRKVLTGHLKGGIIKPSKELLIKFYIKYKTLLRNSVERGESNGIRNFTFFRQGSQPDTAAHR